MTCERSKRRMIKSETQWRVTLVSTTAHRWLARPGIDPGDVLDSSGAIGDLRVAWPRLQDEFAGDTVRVDASQPWCASPSTNFISGQRKAS